MGAIHHDVGGDTGFLQCLFSQRHGYGIVVRLAATATQHNMTILVAFGGGQRHAAFRVDAQETVRVLYAEHGVYGHIQAAIGTVLETHRAGQAGRHFPVRLALGGARANGVPGDQVLQVLRGGRVQRLGGGRQAQFSHIQQQLAGNMQAVFHLEGIVHVRVVDQPFPAHSGTRLLKVDTQHQVDGVAHLVGQLLQPGGIFHGGVRIVDRAGANHHEQAMVLAVQNITDGLAAADHSLAGVIAERQFFLQRVGRNQYVLRGNVKVVYLLVGHDVLCYL